MRAYYNDNDPFVVAWLRELVREGFLPEGEVDGRSIADVSPGDLAAYQQCHFFAGLGGWPLALALAAWPATWPVWTGSCPCQPFSAAGTGAGADDSRDLWPAWFKLLAQCRPDVCFAEQVASPDGLGWFDRVSVDLEGAGYAVAAADLCAASVGAPHNRPRLFIVAQSLRTGLEGHGRDGDDRHESGRDQAHADRPVAASGVAGVDASGVDALSLLRGLPLYDPPRARGGLSLSAPRPVDEGSVWSRFDAVACADGWRQSEPGTFPLAHGVSGRVGRLRGYGNAIVPQVAAAFIAAYLKSR